MSLPNVFTQEVADRLIARINNLSSEAQPKWGKMSVDQMLAHCNVTYEMAFEDKHQRPGGFVRFMLKLFVKNSVVNDKPYKKNGRTAPVFIISDKRNFEAEKQRLIGYIRKTVESGEAYFKGKESLSFGVLSVVEWNNLFYKHLDHHFNQFGV